VSLSSRVLIVSAADGNDGWTICGLRQSEEFGWKNIRVRWEGFR